MQYISASPQDTAALGECMGRCLKGGTIICLQGDLGAGKTILTQGIARGLKIEGAITSPTFTIMNVHSGAYELYHFDLYRLEWEEQLEDVGFDEYIAGDGISIIEWPDKFPGRMPETALWLNIVVLDEERRKIELSFRGAAEGMYKELKENCFSV